MSVYGLDGRVYDGLVYLFTLGSEDSFIRNSMLRLGLKPGQRVLDWGCGTGISLKHIQSLLPEGRVYALDCSPRMAKYAVGRASPNPKLDYHFILRQGTGVELPEKVDATVACYSLCVLEPDEFDAAIEAIWRNTVQDGQLLIFETHIGAPKNLWQQVTKFFTRKVLRGVFADKMSSALLPAAERYFERVVIDSDPGLNARAFLGRRRETVLAASQLFGAHLLKSLHDELRIAWNCHHWLTECLARRMSGAPNACSRRKLTFNADGIADALRDPIGQQYGS